MPDPQNDFREAKVPVYDVKAGEEAFVPASEAEAGISEGRYNRLSNTAVTTMAAGGQPVVRDPGSAVAAGQMGEHQAANLDIKHTQDAKARLQSFDGILTGAQVFVDSLLDTATMGLVHEHGEQAELKHKAHPGAEFAGSMTAFGLPSDGILGAIKNATPLGQAEKVIGAVTKSLIPEVKAGGRALRIAAGAARGAIDNAGLIAGYDIGHQASDALIDDKPFSGEHVAAQIPLGLLLGGAFGAAGEYVNTFAEHEATAKALRDQDGVVNPRSSASAQVHGDITAAIGEWDQAVDRRAGQAKLLRELADSGALKDLPPSYLDRVEVARDAAKRAKQALDRVDVVGALSDGTPAEMSRAAQAVQSYEAAAGAFDHALSPSTGELGLTAPARNGGMPEPGPAYEHVPTNHGGPIMDQAAFDLDARMKDPEMQARYRDIYGKDYEFMPGNHPGEAAAPGLESRGFSDLGGEITPTSENLTNVGKKRIESAPEPDMAPAEAEAADTRPEAARPEPPPAIVEKLEGGKKAKLEDGRVVWRSEHRKMLKEYDAKVAEWEKAKAAQPAPQGPTTRVLPRESQPAGGLAELDQVVEQIRPTTKVIPERFESPGSLRGTMHEATPLGKQVGDQAALDKAAAKADAKTPTRVEAEPFGAQQTPDVKGPTAPLKPINSEPAARQWLEGLAQSHDPQPSPGARASAKIEAHLARIQAATGGKLTATRALEVARSLGVKEQGSRLADQMVQLWALRRLAETAVDAAKGEAKGPGNKLIRKLAANGVAAMGLQKFGAAGFVAGHALGWAANAGAVAGKAKLAVKQVAQLLLKNKRAAALAHSLSITRDRHSDEHYGVQTDSLKERCEQIARAAGDLNATRERIRQSLGDLNDKSPDLASQMVDSTLLKLKNLSIRLPAFAARTGNASVHDLRRFEEYEQATWHPEVILDAIGKGDITPTLARVLTEQHPQLQRILTEELMADPETVQQLPNRLLRQVELITGMPLTRASDPGFILRQQLAPPTSVQAQGPGAPQGGSGPSQRFKMSAPPPTPSQAFGLNGRAPGN